MGAEAGRVEEGVGFVDPAAGGDGGQVGSGPAVPGRPGLLHQLVDAEGSEPVGLGGLGEDGEAGPAAARRRASSGTSAVMSWEPGRSRGEPPRCWAR